MESLLLGLAALACPVGMGLMMWMMMRGQKRDADESQDERQQQQVEQLRAEIEQLKTDRAERLKGGQ